MADRNSQEDELMRASRSLLAGDRLAGLASREVRSRPSAQELEELEAYRGKLRSERSPEDRLAHRATILSENVRSRGFGSVAFDGDDAVEEAEHDRLSVKSEESETGSDVGVAGRHASEEVGDFVDVTKLSAASRRSAAPHIYNIFEQIFCDTEVAHQRPAIPDLPDAVRASMRASGVDLEEELGLTGTRAEVVMTIEESWHALTAGTGIANRLEKQLVADLSIALRVNKTRIHVTNVRAADSGGSRAIAELQFLPASDSEPTALEIAEALSLQAGTPKSMLHAMNSTRHASNVRFREVQPAVLKGLQGGQSGPYEALLRGGVVVDDRGVRPTLSAVHGVASSQLKAGERSAGGHRDTTSIQAQQRDAHALSMVEAARRQQEGFWVDVDRGVYQPVQTNKYGTFHSARGKKMPVWVWTALVFGGTLMVALTCWLIYFKFYAAGTASSPVPRPPPAPLSPPTAQQASPPAGEAEGTTSAAAKAAIRAAADAQAAADKSLNVITAQHPQPDKTPSEPAPAAPAAPA